MFHQKVIKKEREEEIMNKIIQKLPYSNDEVYIEYNSEEIHIKLKLIENSRKKTSY